MITKGIIKVQRGAYENRYLPSIDVFQNSSKTLKNLSGGNKNNGRRKNLLYCMLEDEHSESLSIFNKLKQKEHNIFRFIERLKKMLIAL